MFNALKIGAKITIFIEIYKFFEMFFIIKHRDTEIQSLFFSLQTSMSP